jgi:hypothetical protein
MRLCAVRDLQRGEPGEINAVVRLRAMAAPRECTLLWRKLG